MNDSVTVPMETWIEWRNLCSMHRCSPENQRLLIEFGDRSLSSAYQKVQCKREYLPFRIPFVSTKREGYGFHELEVFLLIKKEGISAYKKHLLDNAKKGKGDEARNISNYVYTTFLRSVIRKILQDAGLSLKKHGTQSIDAPRDDADGITAEDLWVKMLRYISRMCPLSDLDQRSLTKIAQMLLPECLAALKEKELVCLAWQSFKLPLTHPEIRSITGLGREQVHTTRGQAAGKIRKLINKKYPEIDAEECLMLLCYVIQALITHLRSTSEPGSPISRIVALSDGKGDWL